MGSELIAMFYGPQKCPLWGAGRTGASPCSCVPTPNCVTILHDNARLLITNSLWEGSEPKLLLQMVIAVSVAGGGQKKPEWTSLRGIKRLNGTSILWSSEGSPGFRVILSFLLPSFMLTSNQPTNGAGPSRSTGSSGLWMTLWRIIK